MFDLYTWIWIQILLSALFIESFSILKVNKFCLTVRYSRQHTCCVTWPLPKLSNTRAIDIIKPCDAYIRCTSYVWMWLCATRFHWETLASGKIHIEVYAHTTCQEYKIRCDYEKTSSASQLSNLHSIQFFVRCFDDHTEFSFRRHLKKSFRKKILFINQTGILFPSSDKHSKREFLSTIHKKSVLRAPNLYCCIIIKVAMLNSCNTCRFTMNVCS